MFSLFIKFLLLTILKLVMPAVSSTLKSLILAFFTGFSYKCLLVCLVFASPLFMMMLSYNESLDLVIRAN